MIREEKKQWWDTPEWETILSLFVFSQTENWKSDQNFQGYFFTIIFLKKITKYQRNNHFINTWQSGCFKYSSLVGNSVRQEENLHGITKKWLCLCNKQSYHHKQGKEGQKWSSLRSLKEINRYLSVHVKTSGPSLCCHFDIILLVYVLSWSKISVCTNVIGLPSLSYNISYNKVLPRIVHHKYIHVPIFYIPYPMRCKSWYKYTVLVVLIPYQTAKKKIFKKKFRTVIYCFTVWMYVRRNDCSLQCSNGETRSDIFLHWWYY